MIQESSESGVLGGHRGETAAEDDGYRGQVVLIGSDSIVTATATIVGHFDPLSGAYSWYGRLAADPAVTELARTGGRRISLRTPHGEVTTSLSDQDPWGRYRVEGSGRPPFPVTTDLG
jgi:hypothetical protein